MGFLEHKLGRFQNRCMWRTLECLSSGIVPKNRKTCGWDLLTLVERAVACIFWTYDANLIFIRSFSQKCVFIFFWCSFRWKSKDITILEKLKNRTKKQGILKKKSLSCFQEASLTKMEGANHPEDSRVACLVYLSYTLHSICVGLNANLAVVILQMHCQMKLRTSPCSVFPCFNPEVATTFWVEIVFFPVGTLI